MDHIKDRLGLIYNEQDVKEIWQDLKSLLVKVKGKQLKKRKLNWDERDVVLITYADQFKEEGNPNPETFKKMYDRYLADKFEVVHLLPFYPYSSDDGFSVIDYEKVDPTSGDWEDIKNLSKSARLMFDFVCNHISAQSEWFREFLKGNPQYQNFFIEMDPATDLSEVTRPRSTPLLTEFEMDDGTKKHIWTTFSDDQIDLNYSNPRVLLKMIEVLMFYVEQGAEYIRLDAVGFMWKEPGTASIHLKKTHQIVKLFRDIIDEVSEGTIIITETNVPHKDNISYFGNGEDEAHLIYQFPLPPLVLYSIHEANGTDLTNWAKSLKPVSDQTTFFNFLASHDGIGLNPLRGIIPEGKILHLVNDLKEQGALISYKKNRDGSESPYEVNVTYMDALNKKQDKDNIRISRFLVAHSILLSLPGVPAIYIQSVLGSRNYTEGVKTTGMNRTINRQKYEYEDIVLELSDENSLRRRVFDQLSKIIKIRKNESLFDPHVPMEVMELGEEIFALRRSNEAGEEILLVHNLANKQVEFPIFGSYVDLVTDKEATKEGHITLEPYQFLWLKNKN